jgi:hypothetical protein
MHARWPLITVLLGVVLAGCDGIRGEVSVAAGAGARVAPATGAPTAQHVCVPQPLPYAPPAAALSFTALDHPGNEWTLPVRGRGISVRFTITQRPDTEVSRVRFVIQPENKPFPGNATRTIRVSGEHWGPGDHQRTVTWDGTDDRGRPVPAGTYHLYAEATSTVSLPVTCRGSGKGIQRITGSEGYGLGLFVRSGTVFAPT